MGRQRWSNRGVIEDSLSIGISDLKSWGHLIQGYSHGCFDIAKNSEKVGSVSLTVNITSQEEQNSYIQINYEYNSEFRRCRHIIEHFSLHFGNYRYYFRCKDCRRRVLALYYNYIGGEWACRHCLALVYMVSRIHRSKFFELDRSRQLRYKADKLKERGHPRKAIKYYCKAYLLEQEALHIIDSLLE